MDLGWQNVLDRKIEVAGKKILASNDNSIAELASTFLIYFTFSIAIRH